MQRHRLKRFWFALFAFCCLTDTFAADTPDAPSVVGIGEILQITPEVMSFTCPQAPEKVVLLFDSLDTGLKPIGCDPHRKLISFRLLPPSDATPSVEVTWSRILGRPWDAQHEDSPPGGRIRQVSVTLMKSRLDGSDPSVLFSGEQPLRIVSSIWIYAALLVLTTIVTLIGFGRCSGMLRDANSKVDPDRNAQVSESQSVANNTAASSPRRCFCLRFRQKTGVAVSSCQRSYSHSRVQMAWWFALIFIVYAALSVVTLDWPTLNGSTLALLGIPGVAGLASAGIDSDRTMPHTDGFWNDILTDVNGITLARFQMLVWNLAVGLFFLFKAITDLRFPELDPTILGLLGLSAGAYVGLKIPEKHST